MANGNTLYVVNYFPNTIDVSVTSNAFNCCDAPQPGFVVGAIPQNGRKGMFYVRTDGHGCNGRQGQFELAIESDLLVDLNFDSNGDIVLSVTPNNFGCYLSQNGDGTYSLVVGPVVSG